MKSMPPWIEEMQQKARELKMSMLAEHLPIFAAALEYHQQGLWPIPVHPDKKQPLIPWTEFETRQPAVDELYRWWAEFRYARLGLITGAGPGLVVVDVDPRNGGNPEELEVPAGAPQVRTPSGGLHYYLGHPGHRVANRVGVRPGVDVRGDGGLVLAPTSPGYVWEVPLDGSPLPIAPQWVAEESQQKKSGDAGGDDWFSIIYAEATPEGRRNDTATRLAGHLLHRGLSPQATIAILRDWAARCVPPFPEEELVKVVDSISKREAAKEGSPALQLSIPKLLNPGEVRFVVDGLVPAATLTVLSGKDKEGKTLLAQELARAVRTGLPLFGQFAAVQGPVIGLFLDDPVSLTRERLESLGLMEDEALWIATHGDADAEHPKRLFDALQAEAIARRPALIVVDALYVFVHGNDQLNQAGGMRHLVRRLDHIAEETGAAVLLVHHLKKDGKSEAGSFVIRAAAKMILRLSRLRNDHDGHGGADTASKRLLHVEGKYLPETSYALEFSGPGRWRLLGEAYQVRMEDLEASVEAEVSREPGLTAEQIAKGISRRRKDVEQALSRLAQKGRVHSRKAPTGGRGRSRTAWWPGSWGNEGF